MKTIKHPKIAMLSIALLFPVFGSAYPFVSPYAFAGQSPSMNTMSMNTMPYGAGYPNQAYSYYPYYSSYQQNPYYAYPYQQSGQYYQQPYRHPYSSYPQMNYAAPNNYATPSYATPNYQFSNMTPFGNSFSPQSFFNNNNYSAPWKNSNRWNPWQNGNNSAMPFFPQQSTKKKKAWGDVRNIWPDFYTDFTEDMWDTGINAPSDAGRMPGGWKAPSLSSPDPVTVGDAVLNQFPPIMEEMGNMMDFAN